MFTVHWIGQVDIHSTILVASVKRVGCTKCLITIVWYLEQGAWVQAWRPTTYHLQEKLVHYSNILFSWSSICFKKACVFKFMSQSIYLCIFLLFYLFFMVMFFTDRCLCFEGLVIDILSVMKNENTHPYSRKVCSLQINVRYVCCIIIKPSFNNIITNDDENLIIG